MKQNLVFVTGASKGLGLCVSEILLRDENLADGEYTIINISRSNSPTIHEKLLNFNIDLTDTTELEQSAADLMNRYRDKSWNTVTLINNAATINPISKITEISAEELTRSVNINYITPVILTKHLIKIFADHGKLKIINVSSGAANANIDGWSVYCSTKAALNRFTENMDSEYSENKNISFMIFNPGIMDTSMQREIRDTEFKDRAKFIDFKENGDLRSPEIVAKYLVSLMIKNDTNLYESI